MHDLRDRTLGVLLGTALGDAFGAPFEGAPIGSLDAVLERRASTPRPWRYTDDTQMTLAVARVLERGGELDPERLMAKLAGSFAVERGYGKGMRRCVEAYLGGTHWSQCAFVLWQEGSAGNGSAARVAPVACRYWTDHESLVAAAALSSRVTHAHPDAISGAVLQACAVALALQSDARSFVPVEFLERLARLGVEGWAAEKLDVLRALLASDAPTAQVARALGNGVLSIEAVPAALWAFLRGAPSFERCVLTAAQLGGDVDTICALSGALAGALCGGSGLPQTWLANLAHEWPSVAELEALARRLAFTAP